MGVQEADHGVDVVDCGGEGVRWRVAVCCGDDDGAGVAGDEVAEAGFVFGEATHEAAAVDVEMQRAEIGAGGGAGLVLTLEYQDAERVPGVDGDVLGCEGPGEEPWGENDGVRYERSRLEEEEHAPAVSEGNVAGKEPIDGWT